MPFEVVTTQRSVLQWRSQRKKRGCSVAHLIEEVKYILYSVKQHGIKGHPDHGLSQNDYLVELGVMRATPVPIDQEWLDPHEVVSQAAVEAALADLLAMESKHPTQSKREAEIL